VRRIGDAGELRDAFFSAALKAVQQTFPVFNEQVTLSVQDLSLDTKPFSPKQERGALLQDITLGKRLRGTLVLSETPTGRVLDKRKTTLAFIPYVTPRGTFIYRGNEYGLSHQLRLRPGIYTRVARSGLVEAPIHVKRGGGLKITLDPASGEFRIQLHQANLKLYPVLRALGFSDDQIREAWGEHLLKLNRTKADPRALSRAVRALVGPQYEGDPGKGLREFLRGKELDPRLSQVAIGRPADRLDPQTLLDISKTLISLSRGETRPASRDALYAQRVFGPPELLRDYISRSRLKWQLGKLLWKLAREKSLEKLPAGFLNPGIKALFETSGLAQPLEEVNPLEPYDLQFRLVRSGEGGVSARGTPLEARFVQPSHAGFIDPIRTAESEKVGVDLRFALGTKITDDGELVSEMQHARSGARIHVPASKLSEITYALPDQKDLVRPFAIVKGLQQKSVRKQDIDAYIPNPRRLLSPLTALVPMLSSISPLRALMGAKFAVQAVPLEKSEPPLVQAKGEKQSVEKELGPIAGALRSPVTGRVTSVTDEVVRLRTPDGKLTVVELYKDFPLDKAAYFTQTPVVQVGQQVKQGELLAHSNYTAPDGTLALGTNLTAAFLPSGLTYEDAIAISESAAKKLTSVHLEAKELEKAPGLTVGKRAFVAHYPTAFTRQQLENIDDGGLVKPGTVLHKGDPIMLAVQRRTKQPYYYSLRPSAARTKDASVIWDDDEEGIVTDAVETPNGWRVFIKVRRPMLQGDKLGLRAGSKGVVTVVADEDMPKLPSGKPVDMLISPMSIISRQNPALVAEALLAKVAQKRGQPIVMPQFPEGDRPLMDVVKEELLKAGVKPTEDLIDPKTGQRIPDVLVGPLYVYKLSHTAKGKIKARELEAYTAEETPVKGGKIGGKRIGGQTLAALLAHTALGVIGDATLIRGARNEDFWNALRLGAPFAWPQVPYVHKKLLDLLTAAGIKPQSSGGAVQLLPLTDRDIEEISAGPIRSSAMVDMQTLRPLPGGLFDPAITGGPGGDRFAHIDLPFRIVNPVMEKVVATLLHIPQKRLLSVLFGAEELGGKTGSEAVRDALARIKPEERLKVLQQRYETAAPSARPKLLEEIKYLRAIQRYGIKPEELMLSKIPVLPPRARPIAEVGSMAIISDPNYLYKDLIDLVGEYEKIKDVLPEKDLMRARALIYRAARAAIGLGDPLGQIAKQRRLKGILGQIFGSTQKLSFMKSHILSRPQDVSALAVITPAPYLDMDHIGIPEATAWEVYGPFVIRKLVQSGLRPTEAVKHLEDRTDRAKQALQAVMRQRPVIVNRAPTLHKFGMLAFWPVLTKGYTFEVNPAVCKGFNADFDGDTMLLHVPVSPEAVRDAVTKMLPSRNLINPRAGEPAFMPIREFAEGLYLASREPRGKARHFASAQEAKAALLRGELKADQPVLVP